MLQAYRQSYRHDSTLLKSLRQCSRLRGMHSARRDINDVAAFAGFRDQSSPWFRSGAARTRS
jgi:hypothetical protein